MTDSDPKTFLEIAAGIIGEKKVAEIMNRPFGDGAALNSMAHPGSINPETIETVEFSIPAGCTDATMVGRVARQLWNNIGKQLSLEEEARRVIEAMREPTPEMVEAMTIDHDIQGVVYLRGPGAWKAAIDAALKEP